MTADQPGSFTFREFSKRRNVVLIRHEVSCEQLTHAHTE